MTVLRLRSALLLFLFTFITSAVVAGILPYNRGILRTPHDFSSTPLVNDISGKFTTAIAPVWTGTSIDRSKKGIVSLGVDHHFPLYMGQYRAEVKIVLTKYTTLSASGVNDTITLEISNYPEDSLSFVDKQSYTFNNVEKFDVKLVSVKMNGTSQDYLIENLYVQGDIYVDRVYDFTAQSSTNITINSSEENDPLDLDCDDVPDEFVISWNPVEGAEEYQVEWVHINDYDKVIGDLFVNFKLNSTRISTSFTNYHLSLIFDKGYICYRVRAVGRSTADVSRFIFTPWTTSDGLVSVSSCDYYRQTIPFDALKNWQYSSTYAEEGKKKEVVSFFDGSLRNRQMVTKINSDKTTIVGETIYDHQGRPAIQVLPVPVAPTSCVVEDAQNSLKYYEKFNRKNGTDAYTKLDFDTSSVGDSCSTILRPMHTSSGASNYYSGANPDKAGAQGYLPDAQNFPFSQVEYTPDNTGRISRQGGVGPDFQLGSGHETKYFYGHPFQIQLDRLFGSEVGNVAHYQKNMVIDPNGQVSVSYLDQEGRVVATSLAGKAPDNLLSLESAGNAGPLTVDLFGSDLAGNSSSNVLGIDSKSKVFNQTILLTSKTNLQIDYDIFVKPFRDTCLDSSFCFNCIYDLKIEVRDNCGKLVSPSRLANKLTGHFEKDTLNQIHFKTDCSNLAFDTLFVIDSLPVGSYQISKILTVNEEAIEAYVAMYVNDSINKCKPGYDELLAEQQILTDNECDDDFSCQECLENLGTLVDYLSSGGTESDYQMAVVACNGPCTPISYYESMREILKGDMMPGGQYGEYTMNANGTQASMHPLSVLNTSNLLPKSPNSSWKHPKYDIEPVILERYYESDGATISRIYLQNVTLNGSDVVTASDPELDAGAVLDTKIFLDPVTNEYYTYPQYLLNLTDFINYYGANPYWANSLVYYHPEYPILKYYRKKTEKVNPGDRFTSESFDNAMMEVNTWDDAVAAGFIKSTYLSETVNNRIRAFMTDTTQLVWDPAAYYDGTNHLENKVANYITINGVDYSMMEFAGITTRCSNLQLGAYPSAACALWGNDVGLSPTENEVKRDEAWMAFRSLYFSTKQKMFQDLLTDLTINDPDYLGYNACIGNPDFNSFDNDFLNATFAPGPIFTVYGQYFNPEQPCSGSRRPYYQNKQVRFGFPADLMNQSPQNVAYQLYLVTGQCPNAASLQSVLNETAQSAQLDDISFSLNSLGSFPGLLLSLNNFDESTPNQNIVWSQTTINPNILEVLWNKTGVGPFATLQLSKDSLDTLGYSWSQVTGFSNLYFTETSGGLYEFTVVAKVQLGTEIYFVPVTGSTTLPIGNCQFEDVCEKNDLGRDMQQLFQAVTATELLTSTTSVNLTSITAFSSFLTNPVKNSVSLNSPGNLSWIFDPLIPAFKITNGANSDYLRLGINSFSPSTFTVSNMNLIESVEELIVGPNNTFDLVCHDAYGNYLVTISCDAVRVTSGGMQAVEMGSCGLPTALLCTGEPYQNLDDLKGVLSDVLVNQNAPFDLYESASLTSNLETQIDALTETAIGTVSSLGGGKKVLTFNFPTDCDLTLKYDSIPGLNFSFDSIVAVGEIHVSEPTNNFGSYYGFNLTTSVSINGSLHTVVLKGESCIRLKECISCTGEITIPYTASQLDSIDSVYINTYVLTVNNSLSGYAYYQTQVNNFNTTFGLTISDPNFVHPLSHYDYFTQISGHSVSDYYQYLTSFVDGIDDYALAQNPAHFYTYYGGFNSIALSYSRYLSAINHYNTSRDGITYDHLTPVSLAVFTTTVYGQDCSNYITYLLGHITNSGVTQTVLEFPYTWAAQIYPTDCFLKYQTYVTAYLDYLDTNPSCVSEAFGANQLVGYYQFLNLNLCETQCGQDTLNHYLNALLTDPSCNLALPVMPYNCPSYTADTVECSRRFYEEYLPKIDEFNASPWAIAHNVTLAYEFISTTEVYEAGLCGCIKPYSLSDYVNAPDTADLPMPMTLSEYCGIELPNLDIQCKDIYQQYLNCVALYNSTAMANESEDLIGYVISEQTFYANDLCNCVDDYCSELNLVSSGLKDFDLMPNILTFCQGGQTIPCPNDSLNMQVEEPFITEFNDPCTEFYESTTEGNAYITYQEQNQNLMTDISQRYIQHCLGAVEHMTMTYNEIEHHFTLYYYDQAGNLVKTVPPEGVEFVNVSDTTVYKAILQDRANNTHQIMTSHRLQTTYLYNSLNQLVAQNMPDQDEMQVFESTLPNGLPKQLATTAIQMVNSNQGYLTGYIKNSTAPMGTRGYLFKTTNGGQNWTRVENTIASDLKRVRFTGGGAGFAVGTSGVLLLSKDGGASWDLVDTYSSNIQEDFVSLEVSSTKAFAMTKKGTIYSCDAVGVLTPHASAPGNTSYTVNEFKDFSLQSNYSTSNGIIYIASVNDGTTDFDAILLNDGSAHYTLEKTLAADLNALSFYDGSKGITAGIDGNISLLSGTGSSDFLQTMKVSGTVGAIDQIHMLNAQTGIARIEENGQKVIRKTLDGGINWLSLSKDFVQANLALIKRSGTANMDVLIQGYENGKAYSKTIFMASSGVITELDQTPVAAQALDMKLVYAYQDGSYTTIFGIDAANKLYRSNTYNTSGTTINFTEIIDAGSVSSTPKQILVLKNGAGVSVDVLLTNGTVVETGSGAIAGIYSAFTPLSGATSLVWLDKITLSAGECALGYNSSNNKIYGKTAAPGALNSFATVLTLGTSVITKLAVHGNQVTVAGTNGGIFTSGSISMVPNTPDGQSISFTARQDHRLPSLNNIRLLSSSLLITGENGLLISRGISATTSITRVKPLHTLSDLYAANEFVNSSVTYFLAAGSNGYFSQFHSSTWAETALYTTSGLTVTDHANGTTFRDIAVNNQNVFLAGDGGKAYSVAGIMTNLFIPAAVTTNKNLISVCLIPGNADRWMVVGEQSIMARYNGHAGSPQTRVFSPRYRDVHFEDGQFGTLVGDHFLVRSTIDGGLTWKIQLPKDSLVLNSGNIHDLRKVWTKIGTANTHFALVGGLDYMATVSGGVFTGTSFTGNLNDIQFRSGFLTGYVSYNKSVKGLTLTPGGNSYALSITPSAVGVSTDTIRAIHVFENQSVAYANKWGKIDYYNKGTNTSYNLISVPAELRDIYFHDNIVGYAVGDAAQWYNLTSVSNDNVTHDILSGGLTSVQKIIIDPEIGSDDSYDIIAISFNSRTTGVYGGSYNLPGFVTTKKAMVRAVRHEGGMFTARFYYDRLGRIVASQNSRQLLVKKFSYTLYDELGRVFEAGEKLENTYPDPQFVSVFGTNVGGLAVPSVIDDTKFVTWLNKNPGMTRAEITRSYYDKADSLIGLTLPMTLTASTQRKRIIHVTYSPVYNVFSNTYQHATHYEYDVHGNIKTILQDNRILGSTSGMETHRFKRMDYTYDLISGNVHRVDYQTGKADQWHHAYNYDADNRITDVYTTKETPLVDENSSIASMQNEPEINPLWDQEASYSYYQHGPLARTVLGDQEVQGIDYVYTLQGWIKGVNSNGLNQDKDPGRDGNGVSDNKMVARDVFGYSLHYFEGDYTPIVGGNNGFVAAQGSSDLTANSSDLYNGNIGRMVTTITNPNTREVLPLGNAYKYDQLNRLRVANSFNNLDQETNTWGSGGTGMYYNAFTYDANGNIETQVRKNHANTTIDNLTYNYHDVSGKRTRNRLYSVNETIGNGAFPDDIDDMGLFYSAQDTIALGNNYVYDAEGRLVKDKQEEISSITWRVDGKVKNILRPSGSAKKSLAFDYDAMGHRVAKHEYASNLVLEKSTYYILDAQGNTMSVYEHFINSEEENISFEQVEKHIYGSSRLGMHNQAVPMLGSQNNSYSMERVNHRIGERTYELSNHLGNVLSVVSDKLMPVDYEGPHTIAVFDDKFDTPGDVLGWGFPYDLAGGLPSPGYSLETDNGELKLKMDMSTNDALFKAVNFLEDPDIYYTLTFDVTSISGYINLFVDGMYGGSNPEIYNPGSYTYFMNYANVPMTGTFGGVWFTNYSCDSMRLDNIKLTYESESYAFFKADIRQSTDYSPFGVTLEGRNLTLTGAEKSRYGYQGSEVDNEVKGEGNSYTTFFRQLDPRLGRWLSIDPKATSMPWQSPYCSMDNNPIWYCDPKGDSIIIDEFGYVLARTGKDLNVFRKLEDGSLKNIGELGKDVNANFFYMNMIKKNLVEADEMGMFKFQDAVRANGKWDYKNLNKNNPNYGKENIKGHILGLAFRLKDEGYIGDTKFSFENKTYRAEDLNNHHFAVMFKALGAMGTIPEWFAHWRAGVAEQGKWDDAEKSGQRVNPNRNNWSNYWGDNPIDYKMIERGFRFYNEHKDLQPLDYPYQDTYMEGPATIGL
ncbi:Ycf48-like protein [compost metagenome]